MIVVVITGPIASGKSTLGRAVAVELANRGTDSAVVDLDLVYEMLDPRGRSGVAKSDERLWSQSRRVAGRLAGTLLAEGRSVVAEGNFAGDQSLAEFERELPAKVRLRLVVLDVDFETALRRTEADPSRGLSKDPVFLSRHYEAFSAQWQDREVLRLDSDALSLAQATDAVAAAVAPTG